MSGKTTDLRPGQNDIHCLRGAAFDILEGDDFPYVGKKWLWRSKKKFLALKGKKKIWPWKLRIIGSAIGDENRTEKMTPRLPQNIKWSGPNVSWCRGMYFTGGFNPYTVV